MEGIHDNAVAKSTAFRVNLKEEVITTYVESTVLIYVIPGVRYCGCVSLITGNNQFNIEAYLTHDNVFGGMKVNHLGDLYKFNHDEFSYRVVSVGVKLFNVGSESTVSGSFEICDYLINLNPLNYCFSNPAFTNALGVQQALNDSPGLFRHKKEYIDSLGTIKLDDQLNYSVGTIQEISDVPLMLKNLNSVHEFRHINNDYICDCERGVGVLNFQSATINENRILVRDHIDNQFFGKLIRLNLSAGNRIVVRVVVNYEVLSTVPEIVQHARVTVGEDVMDEDDPDEGGNRAIGGQRGPNNEVVVTPGGVTPGGKDKSDDTPPFGPKNLSKAFQRSDNNIGSLKEGSVSLPGKGVKDVRRKKDLKFINENDSEPELIDETNTLALLKEEKDAEDQVELVREENAIEEYVSENDKLQANLGQDGLEALGLAKEIAEETGLIKKYYQPFKEGAEMFIDDLGYDMKSFGNILRGKEPDLQEENEAIEKHAKHQKFIDNHYAHVGKKDFWKDLGHAITVGKDTAEDYENRNEITSGTYYGVEEYVAKGGDADFYNAVMAEKEKKEKGSPMFRGEIVNLKNEEEERDGMINLISEGVLTPLPEDDFDEIVWYDALADDIEESDFVDDSIITGVRKKKHYKVKGRGEATENQSKKKKESSDKVTTLMQLVKEDKGLRIRKPKAVVVQSAKKRRVDY